jgi:CO/xanthine dehydrogenase Mo-binding subunit
MPRLRNPVPSPRSAIADGRSSQVRIVHEAHVGGGLGIRGEIYPRGRAGLRRRDAARPPGEWIEGRREHLVCANHLRPQRHKIRTALDAEGRMSKKGSAARSSSCVDPPYGFE